MNPNEHVKYLEKFRRHDTPNYADLISMEKHGIFRPYEYHVIPFGNMHYSLRNDLDLQRQYHRIRETYWKSVTEGVYTSNAAYKLIDRYKVVVTNEIRRVLSKKSVVCWHHIYRRLPPRGQIGDERDSSIRLRNEIFELAIRKFGSMGPCDHLVLSNEVDPGRILDGTYLNPKYLDIVKQLGKAPLAVVIDFTHDDLKRVYIAEQLAHEMWNVGAVRRSLSKGGNLVVHHGGEKIMGVHLDYDLDLAIRCHDSRKAGAWRVGAVTESSLGDGARILQMPRPVVEGDEYATLATEQMEEFSNSIHNQSTDFGLRPLRFAPFCIDIQHFVELHKCFDEQYSDLHGVSLIETAIVVASLMSDEWIQQLLYPPNFLHTYKLAYRGPWNLNAIRNRVLSICDHMCELVGYEKKLSSDSIEKVLKKMMLTPQSRSSIDLLTRGPYFPILKISQDKYYLDYASFYNYLDGLSFRLKQSEQAYKSDALEQLTREGAGPLTNGELRAYDGSAKQIDASFDHGDVLVIAECKAIGRSVGMSSGEQKAVEWRNKNVVDLILSQVDEKVSWLQKNPKGSNFDISQYKRVIGIGVTPFVEFVAPGGNRWLQNNFPRVLTPYELKELLANESKFRTLL